MAINRFRPSAPLSASFVYIDDTEYTSHITLNDGLIYLVPDGVIRDIDLARDKKKTIYLSRIADIESNA